MFEPDGDFIRKFGGRTSGDDDVWDPAAVAVDPAGNVFVANNGFSDEILQFSSTGTFIRTFASRDFNRPQGLTTDSAGNVYVVDSDNFRIQKFTLSPELLVKNSDASDIGSLGLVVNGTTIAANAGPGVSEKILIGRATSERSVGRRGPHLGRVGARTRVVRMLRKLARGQHHGGAAAVAHCVLAQPMARAGPRSASRLGGSTARTSSCRHLRTSFPGA